MVVAKSRGVVPPRAGLRAAQPPAGRPARGHGLHRPPDGRCGALHPDKVELVALAANRSAEALVALAREFPRCAA